MIVYGDKVIQFVMDYMNWPSFSNARAIGFIENSRWQGAVIFDTFCTTASGVPMSVEASVVVLNKTWINRYNLNEVFKIPFSHLGVKRLGIRCGMQETTKRNLIERLGFTYEGRLRQAWPFGGDALSFSMLPEECRWLQPLVLCQQPFGSSSTRSISDSERPDGIKSANCIVSSRTQ